jgi:hypothetical protein
VDGNDHGRRLLQLHEWARVAAPRPRRNAHGRYCRRRAGHRRAAVTRGPAGWRSYNCHKQSWSLRDARGREPRHGQLPCFHHSRVRRQHPRCHAGRRRCDASRERRPAWANWRCCGRYWARICRRVRQRPRCFHSQRRPLCCLHRPHGRLCQSGPRI